MTAGGWDVSYDPEVGAVETEPVPGQQKAQSDALQACTDEFNEANPLKELTEANVKELYRQELKTIECLEEQGYPQSSTPISEQQYVSDYALGTGPSWYAYQALGETPDAKILHEVEKVCPQPSLDN